MFIIIIIIIIIITMYGPRATSFPTVLYSVDRNEWMIHYTKAAANKSPEITLIFCS